MQLTTDISLTQCRKQELRIWLMRQQPPVTLQSLADALGIKLPTLSGHLGNETMPVTHHQKLLEQFNIPVELLPVPMDLPPGPRPKTLTASQQ